MKFKKKLFRVGNSSGFVVDNVIKNSLGIKNGDEVWIELKKVKKRFL